MGQDNLYHRSSALLPGGFTRLLLTLAILIAIGEFSLGLACVL
jgi:hypothetical protein